MSTLGFAVRRVALILTMLLLFGCGSHGGTTPTTLTGKTAQRAAVVSGYQSLGAGMAYPFVALQLTKPAGSQIPGGPAGRARQAGRTFNTLLGLYVDPPVQTATQLRLNYYTDASGTSPAGSMTMGLPAAATGFPRQITVAIAVTGGNLPVTGDATITYLDATGANTMTGTLTLPRNQITVELHLTLSDTLDMGGSAIVRQNGMATNLTNVRGNLLGTLQGDVVIAPQNWTGTASMSLLTGQLSVTLNADTGTLHATGDQTGNLVLNYGDNTSETVTNALTAPLTSGNGTSGGNNGGNGGNNGGNGGNNGGGSGIGATPVEFDFGLQALNASGQLAGSAFGGAPAFFSSATAAPTVLALPSGTTTGQALALNAAGQIAGYAGDSPVFWASPTAAPTVLPLLPGDTSGQVLAINASGQMVGVSSAFQVSTRPAFWASATTAPVALPLPSGATNGEARHISDQGQIVGSAIPDAFSTALQGNGLVWSSPTAAPVVLTPLTGDSRTQPLGQNNNGQVVGLSFAGTAQHAAVWSSATAQPQALPALPGDVQATPWAINSQGDIVGESLSAASVSRAVRWRSGQPQDLNALVTAGSGITLQRALFITDTGLIAGEGRNAQTVLIDFLVTLP